MAKFPKQLKKLAKLPKRKPDYDFLKAYHYRQREPLYVPFFSQLQKNFDTQRVMFRNSRALNYLWKEAEVFNKTMIRKLSTAILDDTKYQFYKTIQDNYLKRYNTVRAKLGVPEVTGLSKAQRRTVRKIAKGINKHTIDKLTKHIYKLGRDGASLKQAKWAVKRLFKSMESYRSDRISKTELARARNDGTLKSLQLAGEGRKRWITHGQCSITGACNACQSNAHLGWIPLNEAFPSGHYFPPAHPNCQCSISA